MGKLLKHLGRWIDSQGLEVKELDVAVLEAFAAHFPECRCRRNGRAKSTDGLGVFLEYLRENKVVIASDLDANTSSSSPPLLEEFSRWLLDQRGLAKATVVVTLHYVRKLIAKLGDEPGQYKAEDLRSFILTTARQCGASAVRGTTCAVRAFLGHQVTLGRCAAGLVEAVPTIAYRRRSSMPRYISEEAVEQIIGACDPQTPTGARDHAVVLLLARLGLRALDVVHLRLDDFDWSRGYLRLSGKSRQETYVPLPQEVGDSVLYYLTQMRPAVDDDHVFLRVRAPRGPLGSSSTVSGIVKGAVKRAGVDVPFSGAHVLRHSVATNMLRQGASLDAIGVVLRHGSVEATTCYAKVDFSTLRSIAQPWPLQEASRC